MKVKIYSIVESPQHRFMHCCDLTDRGKKIFYKQYNIEFTMPDCSESDFVESIRVMLSAPETPFAKPVFVIATSDNGYSFVHYRTDVQTLSNGDKWTLFHKWLSAQGFTPKLNKNATVKSLSLDGAPIINQMLRYDEVTHEKLKKKQNPL